MKNNIPISKWVDILYNPLSPGLCEMSAIQCNRCSYITHPIVFRYKINNEIFGKLELPRRCPKCNAIMEITEEE